MDIEKNRFMKHILLIVLLFLTLATEADSRSTIRGENVNGVQVYIRMINGKETLSAGQYRVKRSVRILPGKHELLVQCIQEGETPLTAYHRTELSLESNTEYILTGSLQENGQCEIKVEIEK